MVNANDTLSSATHDPKLIIAGTIANLAVTLVTLAKAQEIIGSPNVYSWIRAPFEYADVPPRKAKTAAKTLATAGTIAATFLTVQGAVAIERSMFSRLSPIPPAPAAGEEQAGPPQPGPAPRTP